MKINSIKTATGGRLRFGQLIGGTNPMDKTLARNGSPKQLTVPEPVKGHRSRIAPSAAFHHGAPVDDLPNVPLSREQPIAIKDGMFTTPMANRDDAMRGRHDHSLASKVFADAANLSAKPKD